MITPTLGITWQNAVHCLFVESLPQLQLDLDIALESVLLVAPDPVAIERLATVLDVDRDAILQGLHDLASRIERRGARLVRHGDSVQLVTAPEAAAAVERFLGIDEPGKLSPAALETLAIVAYHQPVTRAQIEAIRGVNCDRALSTLEARGLIVELGRLEVAGRPAIFGTTPEFLQAFGLSSLDELPPLDPVATTNQFPGPSET